MASDYFHIRLEDVGTIHIRNVLNYDPDGSLQNWTLYLAFEDLVEVLDVADLRGLGDSATVVKSFPSIVLDCLLPVFG